MDIIKIGKDQWVSGLKQAADEYRLIGPVKDHDFYLFKSLEKGQAPEMAYCNTRLSAKGSLYPQSQTLFTYTLDQNSDEAHLLKEPEIDGRMTAILAMRPCDAAAFVQVKRNFDAPDYQDPYWLRAYEKTVLVGLACDQPGPTCFCTSTGGGPYQEEFLDILLVENNDHYLARIMTEKGAVFVQTCGWTDIADPKNTAKIITDRRQTAEMAIESAVTTDNLNDAETMTLYEADFWEDVAFACINCGTCTFLCPTCWCFDIQDESKGVNGRRMRNWDSCMFPLFTLHGSGHNPRGTKVHRVRQRFMHKLKYYVDKYEAGIQCVGCGRCVDHCPVNIDIRKVCELMNKAGQQATTCAA